MTLFPLYRNVFFMLNVMVLIHYKIFDSYLHINYFLIVDVIFNIMNLCMGYLFPRASDNYISLPEIDPESKSCARRFYDAVVDPEIDEKVWIVFLMMIEILLTGFLLLCVPYDRSMLTIFIIAEVQTIAYSIYMAWVKPKMVAFVILSIINGSVVVIESQLSFHDSFYYCVLPSVFLAILMYSIVLFISTRSILSNSC